MPDASGGFASGFFRWGLKRYSGYPVAPSYCNKTGITWRATKMRPSRMASLHAIRLASISLRDYLRATDAATSCSAATRSSRQSEP